MKRTFYVSTGATDSFFTLRVQWEEAIYSNTERGPVFSYMAPRDWHVRNLATTREGAIAKAEELGYDVSVPEMDLNEIRRRKSEEVIEAARSFRHGKYEGQDALEVFAQDEDYCLWYIDNYFHSTRDAGHTVGHLLADVRVAEALAHLYDAQWEREAKRQAERERDALSEFVGAPGERVDVDGDVELAINVESYYGVSRLIKIRDASDNVFVMFTTARWADDVEAGQRVSGTALVKDHSVREGVKQTIIKNAKFTIQGG